jgi:hypothetical protein
VHGLDWLATDGYASCLRTVCLGDGAVQGGQTFEVELEARAERGVEGVARAPERVAAAAGLRTGEELQRGGAGWLELVRDIRVPEIETGERVGTRGRSAVYDCFGCEVKRVLFKLSGEKKRTVDLFQAWLSRDRCSRMFVERAPVTGEIQLLMNVDALISEDLRPQLLRREIRRCKFRDDHLQTTPRSATSSDLKAQYGSPEGDRTPRKEGDLQLIFLCI